MVITHLKEKEILDNSLPSSIIIGPFYINVDNVKQSLSKKRKALATSMLDILAKNLHNEVDSVSNYWPGPSTATHKQPWAHGVLPLVRCPGHSLGCLQVPASKKGPGYRSALTPAYLHVYPYVSRRLVSLSLDFQNPGRFLGSPG